MWQQLREGHVAPPSLPVPTKRLHSDVMVTKCSQPVGVLSLLKPLMGLETETVNNNQEMTDIQDAGHKFTAIQLIITLIWGYGV